MTQLDNETELQVRRHMVRGSAWMVAMRWAIRGIGLVNTVILARLLTPSDFGIVAMAMLVVGLIEIFADTGQRAALIRYTNLTREHYDSAWTAQIVVSTALAVILFAIAPLGGSYFNDPRLVPPIHILAFSVCIVGFENIGTVEFSKALQFDKDFKYNIYKKLMTFSIGVILALLLRNYWALVLGTVIGRTLGVVLSYLIHPYRPRWCTSKIREIWGFSIWLLVSGLGAFFQVRLDNAIIASTYSANILGQYTLARELAALPTTEIVGPISRALFPTYAKITGNPQELRDAYVNVLSVLAIICASAATGLAVVAPDLVPVVLGPQWADAAGFTVWLALASGLVGYSESVFLILTVAGYSRKAAMISWSRLLVTVPVLLIAAQWSDPMNFAVARCIMILILAPTYFFGLSTIIPITAGQILAVTWRPVLAAAMMAVAVLGFRDLALAALPLMARLVIEVSFGAVIFVLALFSLWLAAACPPGPERAGLRYLAKRMGWRPVAELSRST